MATFNHLPFELRRYIWNAALPGPRVIEISTCNAPRPLPDAWKPPVVLHICHESREVALERYSQSFATSTRPNGVWIYPKLDIVNLTIPLDAIVGRWGA